MKKIVIVLIASLCCFTMKAQNNPFDVNIGVNVTHSVGQKNTNPNTTPTANGMVFRNDNSGDPLYYKIIDDSKLLVEVTDRVRSANLSGTIRIPSTVRTHGKTYKVVNIGENAFDGCAKITSVEIMGDNLQKLCHNCFRGCTGLTRVNLNPNCLNLKNDAFIGCTKLQAVRVSLKANNFSFDQCPAKVEKF